MFFLAPQLFGQKFEIILSASLYIILVLSLFHQNPIYFLVQFHHGDVPKVLVVKLLGVV